MIPLLMVSLLSTAHVEMQQMAFSPKIISIKTHSSVTWTNNSEAVHNVVGKGFRSTYILPKQTFTHTFDEPGTYEYYCEPHRTMGMTGTIIVKD